MKLLILLLLTSLGARASFPELFGTSAGTMSIGNQPGRESAANAVQAGALQGFANSTQFSFNVFYVNTNFQSIQNVVIENESNTVNSFRRGDVATNSTPSTMFAAHLTTPLFTNTGPKLNLSIFSPLDRILEADTGEPYRPRYVMYDSRYLRPTFSMGLAESFGEWSFSIGALTGFQSNGETHFVTRTTNGNPSLAKISFNAKPSLGLTASVAKKWDHQMTYLAFQDEMKSKLENRASGETEIASSTSFPFDFKVSSLLFYDPMTVRLGHQWFGEQRSYFFQLEYQRWSSYQSPTLQLRKQGGTINGTQNFEELHFRNILIPRFGIEQRLSDTWSLNLGYFYRPTPIRTSQLKDPGNTLDANKHVGSLGLGHRFDLLGKQVTWDLGYQLHLLTGFKVTKTPGREDGDPSQEKIGSPGYRVGGMIHVLASGLSWMY
jgi:long-subunit fatty acid transport protein